MGDSGNAYIEYVAAIAFLLVIFLAAGVFLKASSDRRSNSSMNTVNTTIPCEGGLRTAGSEACL